MEKEKQIEEMAKVLCSLIKDGIRKDCEKCYFKHDGYRHTCKFRKRAIKLYKAGYGNVKEAVKEALQKEQRKEIKKQEAFAQAMGFTPDTSPYYIAKKYKEKFEYAMKELAEARKTTFMEIMETLRFGYELPIDDIMHKIAKEYGAETEE